MSEHHPGPEAGPDTQHISDPHHKVAQQEGERHLTVRVSRAAHWLDQGADFIQGVVGFLLFLSALFTLGYSIYHFYVQLTTPTSFFGASSHLSSPENLAEAIIGLVSDLLLVLIILEVLSTVLHYLREHTVWLKPFLFIGIISAVREILAISAQLVVTQISGNEFWKLMIEPGVSTGIVLALGITLRLLTKDTATSHH